MIIRPLTDIEALAAQTLDLAADTARVLAAKVEAACAEAQARGPDWLVAVSPLTRRDFGFFYDIAITRAIGPSHRGWAVYGPFPQRLICPLCERRADDPRVPSCTHSDCPLAERRRA